MRGQGVAGGKYEGGCGGVAVRIRPQNMVVSYLVLTGRLLESRWSKSQVVLPRECMSASISRGSICRVEGGRRKGKEEGGTRGGRETGGSGRPLRHTDKSSAHTRATWIKRYSPVITLESQTLPRLNPQHG